MPFTTWKDLPSTVILAINYKPDIDSPSWHWTIFHRGESGAVVLDPSKRLKKNVRTDLGKLKPRWYIPVSISS